MARFSKAFCIPSIGSWLFLIAAQQLLVQHASAQQAVEVPGAVLKIAELGLDDELPSAIDLIGPERGSAGRHRQALEQRLQCWIDGTVACSFADRNDDRVREIRRFLVQGPSDRDGLVTVEFPDQTRVVVQLVRNTELDPGDWDQRVYHSVVLVEQVEAPGLARVPAQIGELEALAYDGAAAVRAALERLKSRIAASAEMPAAATSYGSPKSLVQGKL